MSGPIVIAIEGRTLGADRAIASTERRLSSLGKVGSVASRALKVGAVGAGAAIAGLTAVTLKKGFDRLQGIENATAKLDGLGHSGKSVDRIMGNALASVKGTAFGLDTAATVAASAVAAGIKPGKQLESTLKDVADSATIAGVGMDEMGAIWNKVATANKVQGDVLNQLSDRGIPIVQLLGKELGLTGEEVVELASKGQINFATFQRAMRQGMGGAALKSGNTTAGTLDNVNAAMGRLGATLLGGAFKLVKPLGDEAIVVLDGLNDRLGPLAERWEQGLGPKVAARIEGSGDRILKWVDKTAAGVEKLYGAWRTGDLDDVSGSLGSLATAGRPVLSFLGAAAEASGAAAGALGTAFGAALKASVPIIEKAAGALEWLTEDSDRLNVVLGVLATGFVAAKAAQVGSNIAMAASPALRIADMIATRQQTRAIRDLTAAQLASGGNVGIAGRAAAAGAGAGGVAAVGNQAATATTQVSRFGRAAKIAGGAAGIGALAVASTSGSDSMRKFGSVAAGALLGLPAGPIGVAAGALGGLVLATDNSTSAYRRNIKMQESYRDSLDQTTGRVNEGTRRTVYKNFTKNDTLAMSRSLGIPDRDVIDAAVGDMKAFRRVREGLIRGGLGSGPFFTDFLNALRREQRELGVTGDQIRRKTAATADLGTVLKGFPRAVVTQVEANGLPATTRGITNLARRYKLTPKQIRTLVLATGTKNVQRDVRQVQRQLRGAGRTRTNLRPWQRSLLQGVQVGQRTAERGANRTNRSLQRTGRTRPQMQPFLGGLARGMRTGQQTANRGGANVATAIERGTRRARPNLRAFTGGVTREVGRARQQAQRGGQQIGDGLRRGTGRARADLGGFNSSLGSGIGSARGTASSGGNSVGAALRTGVIAGFAGTQSVLAANAAAAVNAAVAAARRAAQSRSPSRKFMKVGAELGDGLLFGWEKKRPKLNKAARRTINMMLKAAGTGGRSGVADVLRKSAIDQISRRQGESAEKFRKRVDRWEKRVNVAVRSTGKLSKALAVNAKLQERLGRRVKGASDRFDELRKARDEYAGSVRSSLVEYASVASLEEGHLNSPAALLTQLQDKALRVGRFDKAIRALRGKLNKTSLKQLIDAGADGGLAAAEALVSSIGTGTLAQVNKLTSTISQTGKKLGDLVAKDYHQAGINSQRQVLTGLQKRDRRASQAGNRLAGRVLAAFRKRLGGKQGKNAAQALLQGTGQARVRPVQQRAVAPRRITAREVYSRTGGGQQRVVVQAKVKLSAQQLSAVQRGRETTMDLRAFQKAQGGRR